jgi:hypothetical protein
MTDPVNRPSHYTSHPSGVEPIEVTRHLSSNRGQAFQYIFRHREKGTPEQDLRKALWFIRDEIHNKKKIVEPNEYRRRALLKILAATPDTWESLCYLSLCTAGTFALKTAEQSLLEHIGAQS